MPENPPAPKPPDIAAALARLASLRDQLIVWHLVRNLALAPDRDPESAIAEMREIFQTFDADHPDTPR